jgi:hypothetical protein
MRERFAEVLDDWQSRRLHRDKAPGDIEERVVADQAAYHGVARRQRPDQKRADAGVTKVGTRAQIDVGDGRGNACKRVEQRGSEVLLAVCEVVHLLDPRRSARATAPARMGNGGTSLSHSVSCEIWRTIGWKKRRAIQDPVRLCRVGVERRAGTVRCVSIMMVIR